MRQVWNILWLICRSTTSKIVLMFWMAKLSCTLSYIHSAKNHIYCHPCIYVYIFSPKQKTFDSSLTPGGPRPEPKRRPRPQRRPRQKAHLRTRAAAVAVAVAVGGQRFKFQVYQIRMTIFIYIYIYLSNLITRMSNSMIVESCFPDCRKPAEKGPDVPGETKPTRGRPKKEPQASKRTRKPAATSSTGVQGKRKGPDGVEEVPIAGQTNMNAFSLPTLFTFPVLPAAYFQWMEVTQRRSSRACYPTLTDTRLVPHPTYILSSHVPRN